MYQVNLSKQAQKSLKRLDKRFQKKVVFTLQLLKDNPILGEKMIGPFKGSYRIKIPPVRIIYTPDFKRKIVWIRAIGHRGRIYRS
jgi:mRNA-degrading endonuclease RelE of RelBE toxin-antitoxin system